MSLISAKSLRNAAPILLGVLATGWAASRLPTPGLVFDALFSALQGSEDPTVETVSHFWHGQPNDLAFVRRAPGARPALADPKLRFWRTEFVTPDGLRAFVASVGLDEASDAESGPVATSGAELHDAIVQAFRAQGATVLAPVNFLSPDVGGDAQTRSAIVTLTLH